MILCYAKERVKPNRIYSTLRVGNFSGSIATVPQRLQNVVNVTTTQESNAVSGPERQRRRENGE